MLFQQRRVIPPLVYRPWYDIGDEPWMIRLRSRSEQEALHQFDVGGEMDQDVMA